MSEVRLPGLNSVTIDGYVARDPETKALPNGTKVTEFRLGHTDYWRTRDGESKQDKVFVQVSCFGFAQKAAEKLKNGYPVVVQGQLKMREWESDGGKRTAYSISAQKVSPLQWDNHNAATDSEKQTSGRQRPQQPEHVTETEDIPF